MALPTISEILAFIRKNWFLITMISTILNTPFALFPIGTLIGLLIIILLALLYGWLVGFRLTYRLITVGPRKFFHTNQQRLKPKILNDQRFGEHKFIKLKQADDNDYIQLHYVSAKDKPQNQLMLFLHGFPENWFSWRYQLEEFQKLNYHTVALSLRGYGDSDKPSGISSYGKDHLINDIYQFILKLIENKKNKKIILVAHDWGGAIAWYVAILYPELLDKFIVINAPHFKIFSKNLQTNWKQFFSSWYMFFFQLPILPEIMFRSCDYETITNMFGPYVKNEEELEAYKHYFRTFNDIQCPINYYRASMRGYGSEKIGKKISEINPECLVEPSTLIIWGRKDIALVEQLAEGSLKMCKNGQLKYIDDGSHWVLFEKPKQVNEIMKNFLLNKQQ